MRKDQHPEAKKACTAKADTDETAFRAFLAASLVSLALLTLLAGIVSR